MSRDGVKYAGVYRSKSLRCDRPDEYGTWDTVEFFALRGIVEDRTTIQRDEVLKAKDKDGPSSNQGSANREACSGNVGQREFDNAMTQVRHGVVYATDGRQALSHDQAVIV
jgi:hypothetical protein